MNLRQKEQGAKIVKHFMAGHHVFREIYEKPHTRDSLYQVLIEHGIPDVCAEEYANQPRNSEIMAERRERKKVRKQRRREEKQAWDDGMIATYLHPTRGYMHNSKAPFGDFSAFMRGIGEASVHAVRQAATGRFMPNEPEPQRI